MIVLSTHDVTFGTVALNDSPSARLLVLSNASTVRLRVFLSSDLDGSLQPAKYVGGATIVRPAHSPLLQIFALPGRGGSNVATITSECGGSAAGSARSESDRRLHDIDEYESSFAEFSEQWIRAYNLNFQFLTALHRVDLEPGEKCAFALTLQPDHNRSTWPLASGTSGALGATEGHAPSINSVLAPSTHASSGAALGGGSSSGGIIVDDPLCRCFDIRGQLFIAAEPEDCCGHDAHAPTTTLPNNSTSVVRISARACRSNLVCDSSHVSFDHCSFGPTAQSITRELTIWNRAEIETWFSYRFTTMHPHTSAFEMSEAESGTICSSDTIRIIFSSFHHPPSVLRILFLCFTLILFDCRSGIARMPSNSNPRTRLCSNSNQVQLGKVAWTAVVVAKSIYIQSQHRHTIHIGKKH